MGLLVDLDKINNTTYSDLTNVYIRIDSLTYLPKYGYIRVFTTGFVNEESGSYYRTKEANEVKSVEDVFFAKQLLIGGEVELFSRENFIPPQTIREPQPVWQEYYFIRLKDEEGNTKPELASISLGDRDALFNLVYQLIKSQEPRFKNIRDVL